jgi:DNA (cytosine-5)-methyltransferase 1
MKHLDLFSGIGGFALATEMVWDNVEHVFCDNEPYAQEILKKHWPTAKIYGDIRTLTYAENEQADSAEPSRLHTKSGIRDRVHLLTGGFPCQPFSQAGRRLGTEDDRHLWPEMLRVIREFHPRWVIGENVGGLVTWSEGLVLEQVHTDLESEGYEVQAFIIPAVAVNAPHRRDRVWIIAHSTSSRDTRRPEQVREKDGGQVGELHTEPDNSNIHASNPRLKHGESRRDERVETNTEKRTARPTDTQRQDKNGGNASNTKHKRQQGQGNNGEPSDTEENQTGETNWSDYTHDWSENWLEVATRLCRMDDGIPKRLDRTPRLKALGNAIVPQVAAEIMKVIKEIDS